MQRVFVNKNSHSTDLRNTIYLNTANVAAPMMEKDLMPKVTTEVIGKGLNVKDNSVNNAELVAVNAEIRDLTTIENPLKKVVRQCNFLGLSINTSRRETCERRAIEVVGRKLRAYMTAMKALI